MTQGRLRKRGGPCKTGNQGRHSWQFGYAFSSKRTGLPVYARRIMASPAQEESRSIRENVTRGQRKRFTDGKVSLPYKHFLDHEKGEGGKPRIVPEQAKIVQMIYRMFVEGMMPSTIATPLTKRGIPTPAGKKKWRCTTVESLLTNEKYEGDAILQKRFCADFLTRKIKPSEGKGPKCDVENSHPAIIGPAAFDEVHTELARHRQAKYNGKGGCFSSRFIFTACAAVTSAGRSGAPATNTAG